MQPGQPGQQGAGQPGAAPGGYGQPPQTGYGQPPGGQPAGPAAPPNPAQKPAAILLACAVVLAIGLFTKGWASASEGRAEINAGLLGFEGCNRGHCASIDWDEGEKRLNIPGDVGTFRILGLIAGIVAMAGLGVVGGMGLTGNTGKIPTKPMQIVLGVASGTLTYFAFRLAFSDRDVDFGPSFSPFLAIGAIIGAGYVLRKMIEPLVRAEQAMAGFAAPAGQVAMAQAPMAQAPMAQAPAAQAPMAQAPVAQAPQAAPAGAPQPPAAGAAPAAPACPTCGSAPQYVEQYQRYYCATCQKYL